MSNPLLTLPPAVGNRYFYQNKDDDTLYECEITDESTHQGVPIYVSRDSNGNNWTYWPDGEAKVHVGYTDESYVAYLTEDILILNDIPESEEFKNLRENHSSMMRRLKELGV